MPKEFSSRLKRLAANDAPKNMQVLIDAFEDKGFAVIYLLLMAVPALPIPTGGITHVTEVIVMLLALEQMAGRRTIWLPQKWLKLELPEKFWSGTLNTLINYIRKLERVTRPRLSTITASFWFGRSVSLIILIFTVCAFVAPPFSGLDTLPALGVVLLSLAMILEDVLLAIVGVIVGSVGIGLVVAIGRLAFHFF